MRINSTVFCLLCTFGLGLGSQNGGDSVDSDDQAASLPPPSQSGQQSMALPRSTTAQSSLAAPPRRALRQTEVNYLDRVRQATASGQGQQFPRLGRLAGSNLGGRLQSFSYGTYGRSNAVTTGDIPTEEEDPNRNGAKQKSTKQVQTVYHPRGNQWYKFNFGQANTVASKKFIIKSPDAYVKVKITDLYVHGDQFGVYTVSGKTEELILETNPVRIDGTYEDSENPDTTFKAKDIWSSGEVTLKPGKYVIVIKPTSSPFNGGMAAIRFDYDKDLNPNLPVELFEDMDDSKICKGYEGYAVIKQEVISDYAVDVCLLLGLEPGYIDTQNDIDAMIETHNECVARDVPLWISGYGSMNNLGLAMLLSQSNKFKIVVKTDPDLESFVVCRVPAKKA